MIIYPVGPTRNAKGAILSLTALMDPDKAKPVELAAEDKPFTSFRIASEQISISVAAKLDVAAVFKGAVDFKEVGFVFDAVAYTDKYATETGPIVMTRWGAGMRVAVRVSDLKVDVQASFGSVAASTQLGLAKAQYEILGIGLGLDALVSILGDLPPMGEFGLESYTKLTGAVYKALKDYITDHKAELTPVPFAVGLKETLEKDPVADARSVYLAAYWRKRGRSRDEVLNKHPGIEVSLLDAVFALPEAKVKEWLDT